MKTRNNRLAEIYRDIYQPERTPPRRPGRRPVKKEEKYDPQTNTRDEDNFSYMYTTDLTGTGVDCHKDRDPQRAIIAKRFAIGNHLYLFTDESGKKGDVLVITSHGGYSPFTGSLTVPDWTNLSFYAPHSYSLKDPGLDFLMNGVSGGSGLGVKTSVPFQIYQPGENVANYGLEKYQTDQSSIDNAIDELKKFSTLESKDLRVILTTLDGINATLKTFLDKNHTDPDLSKFIKSIRTAISGSTGFGGLKALNDKTRIINQLPDKNITDPKGTSTKQYSINGLVEESIGKLKNIETYEGIVERIGENRDLYEQRELITGSIDREIREIQSKIQGYLNELQSTSPAPTLKRSKDLESFIEGEEMWIRIKEKYKGAIKKVKMVDVLTVRNRRATPHTESIKSVLNTLSDCMLNGVALKYSHVICAFCRSNSWNFFDDSSHKPSLDYVMPLAVFKQMSAVSLSIGDLHIRSDNKIHIIDESLVNYHQLKNLTNFDNQQTIKSLNIIINNCLDFIKKANSDTGNDDDRERLNGVRTLLFNVVTAYIHKITVTNGLIRRIKQSDELDNIKRLIDENIRLYKAEDYLKVSNFFNNIIKDKFTLYEQFRAFFN